MSTKVYEIITDQIVKALEAGTVPWRKPWRTMGDAPKNLVSGKPYRGINIFMLAFQRWGSPYWLTFKQCRDRGGRIRKGEHGTPIVFWKTFDDKEKTDKNGKPVKRWMLRYYKVWNVEQTEGIDYPKPEMIEHDPIPECVAVVDGWDGKPEIVHGGGRACYSNRDDRVTMPELGRFDEPAEYYSTLFHELGHSTGHEKRLNRDMSGCFGSRPYSVEELCAEMIAAMICGHCGIETKTLDNSAAYIATWLGRIKGDPKLVVTAASKAQKGADMILGDKGMAQEPDGDEETETKSDNAVAQARREGFADGVKVGLAIPA
jgi:antirestriction protein ArdC